MAKAYQTSHSSGRMGVLEVKRFREIVEMAKPYNQLLNASGLSLTEYAQGYYQALKDVLEYHSDSQLEEVLYDRNSEKFQAAKKIIIDGVDVSECDHYTDGECYFNYFDGISEGRCTDFKNCDHKQLQRKTAEYEELKKNNDLADVVLQRKLDKLINRNNRLEEELNQIKLLLDGKNEQYNQKTQECEALKKRVELARKENNRLTSEVCDTRNYAGSLQNKLQIATEALDIIANQNFNTPNKICNLAEKELVPCTNSCKYCLQAYAKRALKQIESEEQ